MLTNMLEKYHIFHINYVNHAINKKQIKFYMRYIITRDEYIYIYIQVVGSGFGGLKKLNPPPNLT